MGSSMIAECLAASANPQARPTVSSLGRLGALTQRYKL